MNPNKNNQANGGDEQQQNETAEHREPIWYKPELLEWGDSEFDFDPDQGAK